ncbi:MAG: tRNA pseudouridine(55) synthase TruB [Candidatus Zixiibacteriota bacterium]
MPQFDGLLLCDKPYRLSSHDVINNLRRTIQQKKIGHTGTLDPRATGLLITCLGRATKLSQFLGDADKTYLAEITLGKKSSTYDSEGILENSESPVPRITRKQLDEILDNFRGKIKQKVPAFSAVKVDGKRLYKLARSGKEVETPIRDIEIKELVIEDLDLPVIRCRVTCTKGTYIRSLANDIGETLGCGGYLSNLRRTKVGNFDISNALTLDEIKNLHAARELERHIVPIESALTYPSIMVTKEFTEHVITGRTPQFTDLIAIEGEFNVDQVVSLKDYQGKIMAIGRAQKNSDEINENETNIFFKYVRVLN